VRYKITKVIDHEKTGDGWRKIRESKGVSLRNLAQTMGVSAPYLSDLERGRRNWTDELENRYATALRVDIAFGQVCTCHERDSSYACPKCYAEGHRGHMQQPLVEFESKREYRPEGYENKVLVVECDRDRENTDDFYPHVMVNGEIHRLWSVECGGLPLRKGDFLGLVVDDTQGDDDE
jgi:transcriptional regulator with XRE-family HTH domain